MFISNQHANAVIGLFSKQRKTKQIVQFIGVFKLGK